MQTLKSAVILAGGKGTRLGELARDIPKPLVSVHGRPYLYWQLRHLQTVGVTDVLLLVAHMAEKIQGHFNRYPLPGLTIRYAIETEPLGTGGAVRHALPILPDEFFLLNGDSYMQFNYQDLPLKTEATMTVVPTDSMPELLGNVSADHSWVENYLKQGRPDFRYIDAGVYRLKKSVVASHPTGHFDLGDLWPSLIEKRHLFAFESQQRFYDIGTPERLNVFEDYLKVFVSS